MHGAAPAVHTIATLFEKLCYENKDNLSAGIIVGGWDEQEGGQVYNVPLGGGLFRQPWSIGGECLCLCLCRVSGRIVGWECHRVCRSGCVMYTLLWVGCVKEFGIENQHGPITDEQGMGAKAHTTKLQDERSYLSPVLGATWKGNKSRGVNEQITGSKRQGPRSKV